MMQLRYKLHHPRRSPPRKRLHRPQGLKQAESLSVVLEVEARVPHRHAERVVRRPAGALAQAAVDVEWLQRSQEFLPAELDL